MAQRLYGVGAFDAPVALITLLMLSLAAAAAAFVPARRAASIEPMVALRME
jgi:ABC-type lipoprotein release transport system permease subunit